MIRLRLFASIRELTNADEEFFHKRWLSILKVLKPSIKILKNELNLLKTIFLNVKKSLNNHSQQPKCLQNSIGIIIEHSSENKSKF